MMVVGGARGAAAGRRSPKRRAALACALAKLGAAFAALALLAPALAQAAPTWLAREQLASGANYPDVAFDSQGNAVAVWARGTTGRERVIEASTRPAGGSWSTPQHIAVAELNAHPRAALDEQGNAVAIWRLERGDNDAVLASSRPAGGSWSTPHELGDRVKYCCQHALALNAEGEALAVWTFRPAGATSDIVRVASRPRTGSWSPPQDVSVPGAAGEEVTATTPRVKLNSRGDALVVWERNRRRGTGPTYQYARTAESALRPAGASWRAPETIAGDPNNSDPSIDVHGQATGDRASWPDVAIDPQGNAVAVFMRWTMPSWLDIRIQAATRPAGGSWSTPEDLSDPGEVGIARVEVDARGNAVATWQTGIVTPSPDRVQAATRPAGGSWSTPETISPAGQYVWDVGQPAVNARGDALVSWHATTASETGSTATIPKASVRPAGGSWSATTDLPPATGKSSSNPQTAIDAQGNAVAIFYSEDNLIYTAGYDAAGPQLRDLQVPETGAAGSTLSFSVSPRDVWSDVAWTSWSFGDGATASGAHVSHAYAGPGTYEVTVTSADKLGNVSSARRLVTIAGASGGLANLGLGLGTPQRGGGDSYALALASEARRASDLRSCLAQAVRRSGVPRRASVRQRAAARRRAANPRQRCFKLHGRTPGRVSGLSARRLSSSKIALTFNAPGTDGSRPPAARSYLVKQSSRAIRGARGFARAQTLCKGSCRFSVTRVGERITLTITGLRLRSSYFYALSARDNESGRLGPRSQTVTAKTG